MDIYNHLYEAYEKYIQELTDANPYALSKVEQFELTILLFEFIEAVAKLEILLTGEPMDKKIKKIEKSIKKISKDTKELEKMDKKRDPECEMGKKIMNKKKKK